jgi:probable phosphoglycerate mutase
MEIYLVRHGQTGGNVAKRHQAEDSPLTSEGEEQARQAAEKIKSIEPTHLITSTLVRAVETARIIGKHCDIIPDTNVNFIELRRPSNMYGQHHSSVSSLWFYLHWYLGIEHKTFIDGESYKDLLTRIEMAKNYLTALPSDSKVVVVTHSVFINFFLAHACQPEKLGPVGAAVTFKNMLSTPNTFIKKLVYDQRSNTCPWIVEQQLET